MSRRAPRGARSRQREANNMIYFLALIPATILIVAGYLALYLAQRSEGNFQSFGKYCS